MIYRYTGEETVNLPTLSFTISKGQEVESSVEINHPNFQLVDGASAVEEKAVAPQPEVQQSDSVQTVENQQVASEGVQN